MDWDQLRVVLAIQRSGSFRGAAEQLGVNHATVARALRGAEETLGTRLFDRSRQGLRATQTGELLLPHAEEMETHVLEVQRQIGGLDAKPTGRVRVSMPPSIAQGFFIPLLAEFTEHAPEIEIDVIATNRISDLSRLEADVSIRAANKVDEEEVVGRRLAAFVLGAFASKAYLKSHPHLVRNKGEGAHWINFGPDADWIAESPLPKAKARHSLPEVQMQLEAAAAGLGIAWVPAFLADHYPGVVRIPGLPTGEGRSIWILLHGDLRRTARVRAFVDFATAWILQRKMLFVQ